ncbi:carbohydrate ABC transporter permease [Micromonospora auratinigra]|uniref:Multiple sugar transport system permease protein n=1 Tax=Micromonospora auratinigra TaxID=261654 RepID=A0A1A8Z9A9_9ACTN|nr:carbohydrate ABC transporter permease [Micromonospora auratinigra]SBT40545.1 multiple sugar transport system permease protein [Micromonospora auratinigra]
MNPSRAFIRGGHRPSAWPRHALTAVAAGSATLFLVPILWLIASALRTSNETFSSSAPLSWWVLVPRDPTADNLRRLIEVGFLRNVGNSILVAALTVVAGLAICAMAAFALAVIDFPGRRLVFALVVVSFLVPFEATAIPLSTTFRQWHLDNTITGLVLPGIGNGLAVFMLRQFFLGIPAEIREAAHVDGAGWWRTFWQMYLPLSRPALIGAGLILFLFQWQAYLWPILITSDPTRDVAAVSLARTFGAFTNDYGLTFVEAVIVSILPAGVLLLLQRHFIASVAATGGK